MSANEAQYKVWTWTHPLMLHWMINPGLAINEVFLGQRVPRKMLIEQNSKKSLAERSFIPCPHCNTLHPGAKWSPQNDTAFGNWFGLYCDHCGDTIPCLSNITSLVLWGISYPFWAPFRKQWKAKWLEKQKQRFAKSMDLVSPTYNWIQSGIGFGSFLYIMNITVMPLINDVTVTGNLLLTEIPSALIAGLLYGYVMRFFLKPSRRQVKNGTTA
jgi:hypothetical protein